MTKKRGFEVVSTSERMELNLPKRETKLAAGYDFEASETKVIPSFWKQLVLNMDGGSKGQLKPTLIPTGIKAYMQDDEYLQLTNRSSNPLKQLLLLSNGVGIIDADYYNNEQNEGHIQFQFWNFGLRPRVIKKGDRIGQGIFLSFLKADDDNATKSRNGGFGSTGK